MFFYGAWSWDRSARGSFPAAQQNRSRMLAFPLDVNPPHKTPFSQPVPLTTGGSGARLGAVAHLDAPWRDASVKLMGTSQAQWTLSGSP